jgi:hypothetical protein
MQKHLDDPFTIIFTIAGALFCLGALIAAGRSIYKLCTWARAHGVVTSLNETTTEKGRKGYQPSVEFTARDGTTIQFTSAMTTSWAGYREGQHCTVLCDPRNQRNADILSFARLFLTPLSFGMFGIGMILFVWYF